jgi:urease accessory protein
LPDVEETTLVRQSHDGPLVVQRPFFPEGRKVCHVYVLHPPGGIAAGDALTLDVEVQERAHALITAPAATKIYRSDGRTSQQVQTLRAAPGAMIEWLPQETILFDGARTGLETRVQLLGDAAFIGWDILCFGRPACGERFGRGTCRQELELWRDGRPLVLERTHYGGEIHDASWGLRRASVTATLLASAPTVNQSTAETLLCELRTLRPHEGDLSSATWVNGVVVFRYLGNSVEQARILFEKAWCVLRPAIAGRPACFPRVWST